MLSLSRSAASRARFNVVADDTAAGEQEDDEEEETAEQDAEAAGQDDDEEEEPAAAATPGGMDKRTVIDALGFGHEEKVVLRFDDRFWEGTKGGAVSHWQCLDQRFRESQRHSCGCQLQGNSH